MKTTLITIGDEILIGQIVDSNSAFMGRELNKIGVTVYEIISISDEREHLLSAFAKAQTQSDLVIITGGLGPTNDDITKTTLCDFTQDVLVQNDQVLAHIEDLFAKYISTPINHLNRAQALVPSRATVLHNEYGTAPGMWIVQENTVFVSLPGVPFEMKNLMKDQVLPRVQKLGALPYIYHRTALTTGLGESAIAERIQDFEEGLPPDIKLAYLPSLGMVRLRLSSTGQEELVVRTNLDRCYTDLQQRLVDIYAGEGQDESLAHQVTKSFVRAGASVSIAESCTGGRIAQELTSIPGVSQMFKGSTVTYATSSKIGVLGLSPDLIATHSVVSAPVAEAMAVAAKKLFDSDYAVATTGNAGPSKGDSDAPIGTVYIGVATPDRSYALSFSLGNHRERVVEKAVNKSFELLLKEI